MSPSLELSAQALLISTQKKIGLSRREKNYLSLSDFVSQSVLLSDSSNQSVFQTELVCQSDYDSVVIDSLNANKRIWMWDLLRWPKLERWADKMRGIVAMLGWLTPLYLVRDLC